MTPAEIRVQDPDLAGHSPGLQQRRGRLRHHARRVGSRHTASRLGPAPDQHEVSAPADRSPARRAGASGNKAVAGILVQPVVTGLGDQAGLVGQTGDQQAHAAQIEDRVRVRHAGEAGWPGRPR